VFVEGAIYQADEDNEQAAGGSTTEPRQGDGGSVQVAEQPSSAGVWPAGGRLRLWGLHTCNV